jgi:hypothetical protein
MLKRLQDERGSAVVILAVFLPLVLVLGTFAVDVGNWFTHKRHLQTQADAAALAGGSAFTIPCDATSNANIKNRARQFAGPSAATAGPNNYTPSVYPTGPFNPQVSNTANSQLHVLFNSTNFYDPSVTSDQSYSWVDTGSASGQPCDNQFIDVKMTEKDLPWFFHFLGSGIVPTINAEARAKLTGVQADKGFIPIGVQLPKIYKAQATITSCASSQSDGRITQTLEIPLAPLPDALQTDPNMTLWAPDPTKGYSNYMVPVTAPSFSSCSGDFEGIDVNVQVSGSPNVTPTTSNCSNQFVDCFDTVLLRAYKAPNGTATTPKFGDVRMLDIGCGPGTPYWSSGDATPLPCGFNATATVDWGTALSGTTGFKGTLTMNAGGGSSTVNNITANGAYAFGGLDSGDGVTEPQNVTIDWSWSATGGTWNGNTCTNKGSNKCKDSGTTTVHRVNAASASPVLKVVVANPNNGLPLDSFDQSAFPSSFALTVGLQDTGFKNRQKEVLRNLSSQGSGALNCNIDPVGKIFLQFQNGCTPYYAANSFAPGAWEPCPNAQGFPINSATAPWLCVVQAPGGQGPKIVPDGLDVATRNCNALNGGQNQCRTPACNNPSQYDPSNPNQVFDPATDPRVVKVFLVPYAGLKGVGGNGQSGAIEVAGFAAFYLTNWNGNPCQAQDDKIEKLPSGADAVGHFVKIVDPGGVPNPNKKCDLSDITPCVVVLVR